MYILKKLNKTIIFSILVCLIYSGQAPANNSGWTIRAEPSSVSPYIVSVTGPLPVVWVCIMTDQTGNKKFDGPIKISKIGSSMWQWDFRMPPASGEKITLRFVAKDPYAGGDSLKRPDITYVQGTFPVSKKSTDNVSNPGNSGKDIIDSVSGMQDFINKYGKQHSSGKGKYSKYPRPVNDNGWGIHWYPTCSQSREEIDRFIPIVQSMHMKWVLFLNWGPDMDANVYLVQKLVEAGIMPVMRLYYPNVQLPAPDELERIKAMVQKYTKLGVPYYQIFNETNLDCEWEGHVLPENHYEIAARAFLTRAKAVIEGGGIPGIPGPAPGWIRRDGTHGDSSEYLRAWLAECIRQGGKSILERSVIVLHNYTCSQDPRNQANVTLYWQFVEFHKILAEFGLDIPMIGGEGGVRPEDVGGDMARLTDYFYWCYEYMANAPDYYFSFTGWLLTAPDDNQWKGHAFFEQNGNPRYHELINKLRAANPPVIVAPPKPKKSENSSSPGSASSAPGNPAPDNERYRPRPGETEFPRDRWFDDGDFRRQFMEKYGAKTMNEALIASMRKVCPNVGDSSAYTFECALGFYEIMEAMDLGGYTFGGDTPYPIPSSAFDPWRNEGHKHMPAGREVGIKRVK